MSDSEEENVITYKTFRKFSRKEKNNKKLQELPDDFFRSCVQWINKKEEEFEEKRDPHLLREIENVKSRVKEIFNRRRKKILMLALHYVRSNKVSKNLLPEEEEFFETVVESLKELEEGLLEKVLEGKEPLTDKDEDSETEKTENMDKEGEGEEVNQEKEEKGTSEKERESKEMKSKEEEEEQEAEGELEESETEMEKEDFEVQTEEGMKLVRMVRDVDKFMGPEEEETYGPFEEGDLAVLPDELAEVLIEKERAEATQL
ncbi:MAG: hypothetical protein ACLFS3_00500 [Candidatus Aenigmatarchaeota archaeon]